MSLLDLPKGKKGRIVGFDGNFDLQGKLRQLGIIPGDLVLVLRVAPFDGPVLLEVLGREIALGRKIAEHIIIEDIPCELP
jgi:ferrous iron transport protein A